MIVDHQIMSSSNQTPNLKGGCRLGRLAMFTIFPSNGERSVPQYHFYQHRDNIRKFIKVFKYFLPPCFGAFFQISDVCQNDSFLPRLLLPHRLPRKKSGQFELFCLLNQIIAHHLLATKIVNNFLPHRKVDVDELTTFQDWLKQMVDGEAITQVGKP